MDGVLTDFDRQLSNVLNKPSKGGNSFLSTEVWKKIEKAGEEFWSEMPWIAGGKRLWDYVARYNPTILTAPARHEDSKTGKRKWLKNNLPGVPYIIETKKEIYAEPSAILIDDREKNIKKWNEAGGTGILHKDYDNTIKKIEEIMSKKSACIIPESSPDLNGVMYMLHHIVGSLDRIADCLENKGLLKEAEEVDVLSNTLEAYEENSTYTTALEQSNPTLREPAQSDREKPENKGLSGRGPEVIAPNPQQMKVLEFVRKHDPGKDAEFVMDKGKLKIKFTGYFTMPGGKSGKEDIIFEPTMQAAHNALQY